MTLTQLQYALAVEEHLNFQRAAESCHVSQPSLSAQIKKLESTLGVTLFNRSTNSGVSVTDEGQMVLEQARRILGESQKLEDFCQSLKNEVSGVLKVGMIPTVGPFLVPLFLSRLHKKFPHLRLEIIEDSTRALVEGLRLGSLDVAILSPPAKAPAQLMERFLYYEPFLLYGSQGHPVLANAEIRLSALADHAVTLLDETHCLRDQVMEACSGSKADKLDIQLKQGSLQTLISLVESQHGFTLIPKLSENVLHLKHRREGLRHIIAQTPYRKISLVYNKGLVRRSLVEALHQTIHESLPDSVTTKSSPKGLVLEPSREHFRGS